MAFQVKKILYPTDFSEASSEVLGQAMDMAKQLNATVELLHVVDLQSIYAVYADTMSYYPDLEAKIREKATKDMDAFIKKAQAVSKENIGSKIEVGAAAETICEYAKQHGFDLILIPTHGRKGFKRFLLGSVAERVVQNSAVPVLTLRLS